MGERADLSLNRRRGALLGLAVGDALGAAVEFMSPGSFEPVSDYRGGGAHGLARVSGPTTRAWRGAWRVFRRIGDTAGVARPPGGPRHHRSDFDAAATSSSLMTLRRRACGRS